MSRGRDHDAHIKQAGLDPAQIRADAEAAICKATPPGWRAQFVVPPWTGRSTVCRNCHSPIKGVGDMGVAALTLRLEDRRVLLFTFAMVCSVCVVDENSMRELAARALPR